jgi:hypothetical protein
MKTHLMILLVMVAALFAAAPTASAQGYDGCYGGGWGWGYDMGGLYNSLDYNVPYFAAHPPVYYSYPVPRTYGYSPFAYPPYVMTPDVEMGSEQPMEIVNPYVPSTQQTPKANADQSAAAEPQKNRQPEPLVIINPYVAGAGSIAKAGQ